MAKLKITLKRSLIGHPQTQRDTVNSTVELPDNPCIRGQVHKVEHLVSVEEID